jgi:stage V sporulation protein SpoVS
MIRVARKSSIGGVAGAVAHELRASGSAEVTAVGQISVYRAMLAICCAADFMAQEGRTLMVAPQFATIVGNQGTELTAMQLSCALAGEQVLSEAGPF